MRARETMRPAGHPDQEKAGVESSIIIPVFNQWELTRACLKALAATTRGKAVEVIVIDNASSDVTPDACPFLGKQLFGDAFRYVRFDANRNFGPASNYGARLAVGEFLVFLNNDTVPLPGWYEPLIADFSTYPDIAATGPLLLYPEREPFGHTVQHLGVFVSPFLKVGHLYEGIPADSPLARKRRFFQIITAACMVIRRSLFMGAGMFDEVFINGFEDVDLCARLWKEGYRMTVNPEARVIHYKSQTPGRHQHETANSRYLAQKSQSLLVPDWHVHLKNDGLVLRVGPWLTIQASLSQEQCQRLDAISAKASFDECKALLVMHPFWENGWQRLISLCDREPERTTLQTALFRLYPAADMAMDFYGSTLATYGKKQASAWLNTLVSFCQSFEEYQSSAREMRTWCASIGLADMAEQYAAWLRQGELFQSERLYAFFEKLRQAVIEAGIALHPHAPWAYTLWRHTVDEPRRARHAATACTLTKGEGTSFSILMPVYNPKSEYLTAALDSVLAQDYPHWELCIADDASTDPEVRTILQRYAAQDSRIRVTWREENGHIAAATNTALNMARNSWAALMDQDDLLTPDALRMMAEAIAQHPDGLLFYSDEDKVDDSGLFFEPYFKNGKWDWELLCGQNFVSHLGVYRTDRMRRINGFQEGVRGSQDYDLLLRYIQEAESGQLIHIPHVLYHWRAHADSTALSIDAKPEAVVSARKAVQEYLNRHAPGSVSDYATKTFLRVRYPLPAKCPLVSLICDMGDAVSLVKTYLAALTSKTSYNKREIIILHTASENSADVLKAQRLADRLPNVRFVPHAAELSLAERLNLGAQQAHGQVLGFLAGGCTPATEQWLEELVTCLWRDAVGACGGRVCHQDGTLTHGGYLTDAENHVRPIFCGIPDQYIIWFGWNRLARTVDALDGLCFFTKAETWHKLNGFDPLLSERAVQDYCLRLSEHGLRTVWWPFAGFMLPREKRYYPITNMGADTLLQQIWSDRLVPGNTNLVTADNGWALCTQ